MRLSHIRIQHFRNFRDLNLDLGRSAVIFGANQIGKSNLLYALRLALDPSLPESARQLRLDDFWDGIAKPVPETVRIVVAVDIVEFEDNESQLAILAEHLVNAEPMVARITYEFGPIIGLGRPAERDEDFEFTIFGGDRLENRIGYDVRRRMPLEVLPALRDAAGDLARWNKSPLRPLIDRAKTSAPRPRLQELADGVTRATSEIAALEPFATLAVRINEKLESLAGKGQAMDTALGFSPTDADKLLRALRLLFDGKQRDIAEASLGSANVLYLALRSLELDALVGDGSRDHTFLGIEEPEAHLHPHLQRLVYRNYLRARNEAEAGNQAMNPLTYLLTTHSPYVASVTPVESLVLLRKHDHENSTIGVSGITIPLSQPERDDIERYLDVSRAEGLFARGIVLVEGDAEQFLLPVLAKRAGYDLDALGITVCSVGGTNFVPYIKFFGSRGLRIPLAVATDYDPHDERGSLGEERVAEQIVPAVLGGDAPENSAQRLRAAAEAGVFLNEYTFEVDLVRCGYYLSAYRTMKDLCHVEAAVDRAQGRVNAKAIDDPGRFLADIDYVGKGRYAQRLASHISASRRTVCPEYLLRAIRHVTR